MLSFSNTDIAFRDIMVAGSYHGFNIYQLEEEGVPALIASVVCPGGQGDISIVDHLLIMSKEETRGRVDAGCRACKHRSVNNVSEDCAFLISRNWRGQYK